MKYLVVLAAGAFLLSACGAGGGAAVADGFPPEVEARIEEERQICADGMGALEPVAPRPCEGLSSTPTAPPIMC
ncbi:MAG: hypothetical protein NVV62_09980 [Terricaulis sp.]|nr:hypothetical protein [Terricaulis sp.]